jgi:hypothetical protein
MAEPKTKVTDQDPKEFLNTVEPEQKRRDSFALLEMFEKVTGEKAVMWGSAMVGFGLYHYQSTRSSQKGDWFLVGFSPRKQNLTLYILTGNHNSPLLKKLGKHTASSGGMGGCVYINKLSDVDEEVLSQLVKRSYEYMKDNNPFDRSTKQ